jgi:hypothetical protein
MKNWFRNKLRKFLRVDLVEDHQRKQDLHIGRQHGSQCVQDTINEKIYRQLEELVNQLKVLLNDRIHKD